MTDRNRPVIIVGGGGHATVVADVLQLQGYSVLGYTDIDSEKGCLPPTIPFLGNDQAIFEHQPASILLANGLGSVRSTAGRRKIYEYFANAGYQFVRLVHPSAIVANDVTIQEGVQIMAGAVIQPGSRIGKNVIVNTRASLDHDCLLGDHVHVAPGVTLSGGVCVGEGTHIGTGATIVQGISVGKICLVGAGAVVVAAVRDGRVVVGVPAREVSR